MATLAIHSARPQRISPSSMKIIPMVQGVLALTAMVGVIVMLLALIALSR